MVAKLKKIYQYYYNSLLQSVAQIAKQPAHHVEYKVRLQGRRQNKKKHLIWMPQYHLWKNKEKHLTHTSFIPQFKMHILKRKLKGENTNYTQLQDKKPHTSCMQFRVLNEFLKKYLSLIKRESTRVPNFILKAIWIT